MECGPHAYMTIEVVELAVLTNQLGQSILKSHLRRSATVFIVRIANVMVAMVFHASILPSYSVSRGVYSGVRV